MKYRTNCICCRCGYKWTTKKRRTKKPPAHCPRCFSSMTRVLSYWKVKN